MIQLLIIADDFTGGLDTGVKFAKYGFSTKVLTDAHTDIEKAAGNCEVLVVVTESRHIAPDKAYQIVLEVAQKAFSLGIPHIYKKTDSALRGNVGAELSALLEASGLEMLPFLPAFPALKRTTRKGIQYIDGIPVSDSVFGSDPFDPVRESDVVELVHSQSALPVSLVTDGHIEQAAGIMVFDAETDEDLHCWGRRLFEAGRLTISAGCAGFASVLAGLITFKRGQEPSMPLLDEGLLVLCGSVNPVSRQQMNKAANSGFYRVRINPEYKLREKWTYSPEGLKQLNAWKKLQEENPWLILDSNDEDTGNDMTADYAKTLQLTKEEMRKRISAALGEILKGVMTAHIRRTLLITGGDTLLGCMRQMGVHVMEPLSEIFPGVVLSSVEMNGLPRYVITKSGGFGSDSLLPDLQKIIVDQYRNIEYREKSI